MSSVAVITVAHGRREHLTRLHRSLDAGVRGPDHWVLVAMSDPSLADGWDDLAPAPYVVPLEADRSALPLGAARNLGARTALEQGAEVLVFLDADCLAHPRLVAGYAEEVGREPDVVWSGPVTYLPPGLSEEELVEPWRMDRPHAARPAPAEGTVLHGAEPALFWSLSFATSGELWQRIGGFHEEYAGYGGEDTDLAFAADSLGVPFAWTGNARAYHQHHPTTDPPVQHVDDILRNAHLFHRRWNSWPMLGWLQEFQRMGLVAETPGGWERIA